MRLILGLFLLCFSAPGHAAVVTYEMSARWQSGDALWDDTELKNHLDTHRSFRFSYDDANELGQYGNCSVGPFTCMVTHVIRSTATSVLAVAMTPSGQQLTFDLDRMGGGSIHYTCDCTWMEQKDDGLLFRDRADFTLQVSAVPLPPGAALLLTGLAALAWTHRKKAGDQRL